MQISVTGWVKSFMFALPYPWLQVLPHRLGAGPVPEAQRHLHLPQEHIPPQGLGMPHGQVQGPTSQLPNPHFILKDENQHQTGNI